ncbi:glutathione-disulfide reductase [Litoreibacter janthinus]|uniref:NADPH-glutathione reductase n=1 Tax=Litoreibacter janthinus TaxID=670154 RepID=A0A1I6HF38_9RHOB|nr:glutathione-disulfide reductase [Litoreibacter janthinus]SFR52998.1 NADPH-glutathione reductase [Litoreibacter janthinus]
MEFDFDLFVIGGGSGGVRAARVAAAGGAKVGLAEESRMGGTCVIRGCVPKKLMVFASGYRDAVGEADDYGWDVSVGDFDWSKFSTRLNGELDRLEGVYQKLLKNSGVETFDTRAVIADAHTIELADGTKKTAKHILIATGGRPVRPDENFDTSLAMVSDDIFKMEKLPKSILIVGGGYIACEFACILHGLGVEVTMFYRGAQILRGFDDEARGLIAEMMAHRGIQIHTGTNILDMKKSDDGLWVKGTNGSEHSFEQVLYATGRAPNTEALGLENVDVEVGRRGEILVDEFSQTGQPSIYAIGDVTNRVNLTPVAIREGMAFVETVFNGNPTPVDHELIPSAVFTQPEMGTVGMSEEDARDAGPIDIYSTSFRPMQQAFIEREDRVLMKLVVCKNTDKVLGCHIVAPAAGEMIQLAGIAVKMGATKAQFDQVCAVHPTMSEELVTMKTPVRSA